MMIKNKALGIIRKVIADEKIQNNIGKIAVERGPLVYCAEGVDNDDEVLNFHLDKNAELHHEFSKNLLGGVTVLTADAARITNANPTKALWL